ncbi:MAG: ABC transporter ATP-binding protein, partial [Gammaproteobacteria bacterium]
RHYAEQACVIISSHRIDEISRFCMRLLILHQGKLVDDSRIEDDEQRNNLTAKFHQLTAQTNS